jgi:hypothetical protein
MENKTLSSAFVDPARRFDASNGGKKQVTVFQPTPPSYTAPVVFPLLILAAAVGHTHGRRGLIIAVVCRNCSRHVVPAMMPFMGVVVWAPSV